MPNIEPTHPMTFTEFRGVWSAIEGHSDPQDAYDAYLGGVSEALQQQAMICDLDKVLEYVDRITKIVYMRRDHKQGMRDSVTNLGNMTRGKTQ